MIEQIPYLASYYKTCYTFCYNDDVYAAWLRRTTRTKLLRDRNSKGRSDSGFATFVRSRDATCQFAGPRDGTIAGIY